MRTALPLIVVGSFGLLAGDVPPNPATVPPAPDGSKVGRFALAAAGSRMYRIDTTTGQTWISDELTGPVAGAPKNVVFKDATWRPVYEVSGFRFVGGKLISPSGHEISAEDRKAFSAGAKPWESDPAK